VDHGRRRTLVVQNTAPLPTDVESCSGERNGAVICGRHPEIFVGLPVTSPNDRQARQP
jgi:hypothetical protein